LLFCQKYIILWITIQPVKSAEGGPASQEFNRLK